MNSNMVKPEKFGHLHLVYHFTVPLRNTFASVDCVHFTTKRSGTQTEGA